MVWELALQTVNIFPTTFCEVPDPKTMLAHMLSSYWKEVAESEYQWKMIQQVEASGFSKLSAVRSLGQAERFK